MVPLDHQVGAVQEISTVHVWSDRQKLLAHQGKTLDWGLPFGMARQNREGGRQRTRAAALMSHKIGVIFRFVQKKN